ncbi:MAG: branched-chain amino acid ABC transporter permease [Kiloniellales bacterium]
MLYREAGQFKTSYGADMAIFPIAQDRWGAVVILLVAVAGVPLLASDYLISAFVIPFLIWSLAAIGLNILTGYAGQLSLGHGAFMAVGAYAAYNLAVRVPEIPILVTFVLAGLIAAAFGILIGLPSLRIKGFYLAVATLAAQFFVEWMFGTFAWFTGGTMSMVLDTPPMSVFGYRIESTLDNYYLTLGFVLLMTLLAKNLVRSETGRAWMAIRDMDVAAEVIGIRPWRTKLSAFAVSSFYAGIAGALYAFCFVKSVDFTAFDLLRSFSVLFMIIIGGLGSILGSFLGAGFIVLMPIVINLVASQFTEQVQPHYVTNAEHMVFGGLIIFFLIVEPFGLARLWVTTKEKLRLWPFPH